ncbi:MAG: hypothetical protein ABIJ45_03605 [Candidatus Zixiibacteriota bacterium]
MKKVLVLSFLILVIFIPLKAEENFVNWAAGYYITMPDDWYHVPYSTVNIFLETQNVDHTVFEYDAVIAPRSDQPFFTGAYVFVIHHPAEELTSGQIDSVLLEVANDYQKRPKNASLKSTNQTLQLDEPIYDKELKTVFTKSRVSSEYADKYLLEVRKFYKKGVAIFLCYSPKELYNDLQPVFLNIVNSMKTDNLEAAAPPESAQIIDVKDKDLPTYDDSEFPEPGKSEGFSNKKNWLIAILIAFIAVSIIRIAVSKKKKK